MIKILLGGSPCTYWSIAQKNNRETEPSGIGWELFENYLIAKEKFKPDIFLYENNKSAAQAIKDEIKKRLNVWDGTLFMQDSGARYIEINSALVSAQNRQRFYVHNCGEVGQPGDRGILLRDVLESGVVEKDKAYCLKHQAGNARDYFKKHHTNIALEPVNVTKDGKSQTIKAQYQNTSIVNICCYTSTYGATGVAEPVIFQTPRGNNEGGCKYKKSPTLMANGSWQENNKVVKPVCVAQRGRYEDTGNRSKKTAGKVGQYFEARGDEKTNALTTVQKDNMVAEPVRIPEYSSEKSRPLNASYKNKGSGEGSLASDCFPDNPNKQVFDYVAERVYYGAEAVEFDENGKPTKARSYADGKTYTIYEVKDGKITIKGKEYPIKLADGFYIIRKLTVTECCRLQTMPDNYCRAVSATQGYRGLGNGWTAEVIIHILNGALKDVPKDEEIVVLSMYDGIGTGRYVLDKMGFTNVEYHAYEIDKYAMQIAMSNYPDIIQHGDAYQVREEDWEI